MSKAEPVFRGREEREIIFRLPGMSKAERDEICRDALPVIDNLLTKCTGTDVSDLQIRVDLPVFLHTKSGFARVGAPLTPKTVVGILLALSRSQSRQGSNLDEDSREIAEIEKFIEVKKWDFASQGQDVDPVVSIVSAGRHRNQAFFSDAGVGMTIRLLKEKPPESLEELGIEPVICNALKKMAMSRGGILLVTGPTGSGKTTTLAALVHWLKGTHERHIVTVEDPIEYRYRNWKDTGELYPGFVTQQEVGDHVHSFNQGLKDFLRKRGHVLLVGEIRTAEQFEMAYEAAMTGHLVLTTMHTRSASRTIGRIADFVQPAMQNAMLNMLADSILGIISQALLPGNQQSSYVLAYDFLRNESEASKSAIRQYLSNPTKLEEHMQVIGNVAFDPMLEELEKTGKIDRITKESNWLGTKD